MGSLQSAILGFGFFRLLENRALIKGFTMEENVIVQTTAVATATMPLAAGTIPVPCHCNVRCLGYTLYAFCTSLKHTR